MRIMSKLVNNMLVPLRFYSFCKLILELRESTCFVPKDYSRFGSIYIVTSCTNPSDAAYAVNHNPSHSMKSRAAELIETVRSIRELHPDSHIINLENSRVPGDISSKVVKLFDEYYNFGLISACKRSRKAVNKAVPWIVKVLLFMKIVVRLPNSVHFVVGRYRLYAPIVERTEDKGAYFKSEPATRHVSTRYMLYIKPHKDELIKSLYYYLFCTLVLNMSLEEVVMKDPFQHVHYLRSTGIEGFVNGIDYVRE